MVLGTYYLTYGPSATELEEMDPASIEPRPHRFRCHPDDAGRTD
jgi:hypothetical protein